MIFFSFTIEKNIIPCSNSAHFVAPNLVHPLNPIYTSVISWQLSKGHWPAQAHNMYQISCPFNIA